MFTRKRAFNKLFSVYFLYSSGISYKSLPCRTNPPPYPCYARHLRLDSQGGDANKRTRPATQAY